MTLPASFLRNSLKSLLCAVTVCAASLLPMALACSVEGTVSNAPLLMRLMLPSINASGLARSNATSIWSRETLGCLTEAAILLAVSPVLTLICLPSAGARCNTGDFVLALGDGATLGAGPTLLGGATAGCTGSDEIGIRAMGGAEVTGGAGLAVCGNAAADTAGARRFGGSNSIVKSRTIRPDDQLASRIMSTKGSLTGLSLLKRM